MVYGWYLYETQPLRIDAINRQVITWQKHGKINKKIICSNFCLYLRQFKHKHKKINQKPL